MEKLILKNVSKNYGEIEAVKNISFSIKDNEFVTIVGPSGCGKSSTLRMIAGLESITEGDIILENEIINGIQARDRNIALAFESYALYPHMSAYKNLAFPLQTKKIDKEKIADRVNDTLKLLNLEKYKNMKPGQLSGGQQQRISLGRALIRDASIYLLDEPLSHLDAQERIELRMQLKRIQRMNNLTFILVTHDQLEALEMSDRIIVMSFGEIQQIGTPEELYDDPANLFVADFIGEPPMNFSDGVLRKVSNEKIRIQCKSKSFDFSNRGNNLNDYFETEIVLGIRPSYIEASKDKNNGAIEGQVFSYEDLGENGLLMVQCNEEKFLVEVEGNGDYKTESKIFLMFNEEKICLFTKGQGKRIL